MSHALGTPARAAIALVLLALGALAAPAHAGKTNWYYEFRHVTPTVDEMMKKARRNPEERATPALVMGLDSYWLCSRPDLVEELLAMGADPSMRLRNYRTITQWDRDYRYSYLEPVFWVAVRNCRDPRISKLLFDAGAATASGWNERWFEIPRYRDTMLLDRRRKASRESWLLAHILNDEAVLPVLDRYLRVLETGSDADKELVRDQLDMGGRPILVAFVASCASLGRQCDSPEMLEVARKLVALTMLDTHTAPGPNALIAAAFVPVIDARLTAMPLVLLEADSDLSAPIPRVVADDLEEIIPAKYSGFTLLDYLLLRGGGPTSELLLPRLDLAEVPVTPLHVLQKRMQQNANASASIRASRAEWDAEVEAAAADRTRGRAVNDCIARGGYGPDCQANPDHKPAPVDLSYIVDMFSPSRIEAFKQVLQGPVSTGVPQSGAPTSAGVASPSGSLDLGLKSSEAARSPSAGPPPAEPPCGYNHYGSTTGPGAGIAVPETMKAEYEAGLDRFYAKYPKCKRPTQTPRPTPEPAPKGAVIGDQ